MGYITNIVFSSVLILIPVFNSGPVEVYTAPIATTTPVVKKAVLVKSLPPAASQLAIAEKVSVVLGEEMVDVIRCESNFRQFDSSGNPLVSPTSDVGVMQINQVHWERAKSLGLDIFYSTDDNIIMGKIIFDEQGYSAWTCHNLGVDT